MSSPYDQMLGLEYLGCFPSLSLAPQSDSYSSEECMVCVTGITPPILIAEACRKNLVTEHAALIGIGRFPLAKWRSVCACSSGPSATRGMRRSSLGRQGRTPGSLLVA